MGKGEVNKTDRRSSDATEHKLLDDSVAPSVSGSPGVGQAADPAVETSELSRLGRVVGQQHKKEEIYEPPAVSDIIVQR